MIDELRQRAETAFRNLLRARAINLSRHYQRLFAGDGGIGRDAEIVLADLRDFCRAQKSSFSSDPYVTARNEGRREVFLRVSEFLTLDPAQVRALMELEDGN